MGSYINLVMITICLNQIVILGKVFTVSESAWSIVGLTVLILVLAIDFIAKLKKCIKDKRC